VLTGRCGLIDKMIAERSLQQDLQVLSDLLALSRFDVRGHEAALRRLLAPIGPAERDLASAFQREYLMQREMLGRRFALSDYEETEDVPGKAKALAIEALARISFKRQATLNLNANLYLTLGEEARLTPMHFRQAGGGAPEDPRVTFGHPGPSWIYNPPGRLLTGISAYALREYPARLMDLTAYLQLVRAQLEVRIAGIAPEQVAAFLAAATAVTRNPYTEQPFAVDLGDGSISFVPASMHWTQANTKARIATR
jgi:hypothetical protein